MIFGRGEPRSAAASLPQSAEAEPAEADYREMLRQKDLDIVLIATPDHWHALPMIAACEAGVDIYVQKPISVDVAEGRAMLEAARKHQRVVQVGTQRRSTPHLPTFDHAMADGIKICLIRKAPNFPEIPEL